MCQHTILSRQSSDVKSSSEFKSSSAFFTFLTFFCGLHCSIPYTSQQQDLFVTTHCTHTITLCTDIFSSSGCILLFMQEKRSLTISVGFFFQSLLETRPSSLPLCKLFYFFDTSNTSYSNPGFFFSRSFQVSVWNTGSSGEASAAEGPQCTWAPRTRDRGRVNSSSPCFLTLAVLCCVTFQTRLLSKLK